ncbi:MAG: divergent polysaccharide deacetylase family protein [Gammaproteobacteria bacterium]|nr:divergent polysaccharide deacetylase family protein [Gammaproteobacteria bacterium]
MRPLTPLIALLLLLVAAEPLVAEGVREINDSYPKPPRVAIIIDDIGENISAAKSLIALPAPLTFAVLPYTTHNEYLAKLAYQSGKEVMLHQPMQPLDSAKRDRGMLMRDMSLLEMEQTLRQNLAQIPHAMGINNHMGSLLTQDSEKMGWLMRVLRLQGDYYFIDSRTSGASIALKSARQYGIATLQRQIFLDNNLSNSEISQQFQLLINHARQYGSAIAIGHPYHETIAVLKALLPTLAQHHIEVVPVSTLIKQEAEPLIPYYQEIPLWQASLSPLQQDSKSLKQ